MRLEEVTVRAVLGSSGEPKVPALHGEVLLAVLELLAEAAARPKLVGGRDRDVASVEERVDIRAEQETIRYEVLASLTHGADVGGLENRKRLFLRYGAASLIRVHHEQPKGPLPQPLPHKHRVPVHGGKGLDMLPRPRGLSPENDFAPKQTPISESRS